LKLVRIIAREVDNLPANFGNIVDPSVAPSTIFRLAGVNSSWQASAPLQIRLMTLA